MRVRLLRARVLLVEERQDLGNRGVGLHRDLTSDLQAAEALQQVRVLFDRAGLKTIVIRYAQLRLLS